MEIFEKLDSEDVFLDKIINHISNLDDISRISMYQSIAYIMIMALKKELGDDFIEGFLTQAIKHHAEKSKLTKH